MKSHTCSKDIESLVSRLRKNGPYFEEYTVLLFSFIQKLYATLQLKKAKSIVFLSREGYFLKILFDHYQELRVSPEKRIISKYFKCSRHALQGLIPEFCQPELFENISLRDYLNILGFEDEEIMQFPLVGLDIDAVIPGRLSCSDEYFVLSSNDTVQKIIKSRFLENSKAFHIYAKDFFDEDKIYLCDIGYFGTMQDYLQRILCKEIEGYYIGRIGNQNVCDPNAEHKHGLIFEYSVNRQTSRLHKILRSNMLIVEMLLYAPHGSVQHYSLDGKQVKIVEVWKEQEKNLYYTYIEKMQLEMLKEFIHICQSGILSAGDNTQEISVSLARMTLRDGLLPSIQQIQFLIELQNAMYSNYWKDNRYLRFRVRDANMNFRHFIKDPEDYVHYIVKAPVWFYKHKLILFYYPLGLGAYLFYNIRNRLI